MSEKHLDVPLKPLKLRYSSATHYIQIFGADNIGGSYYCYGWKYGSKEAETYTKTHLFGREQGQRKEVEAVGSESISQLERQNRALREKLENLSQGSGVLSLITTLVQRQGEPERIMARDTGKSFDIEVKSK